MSLPEFLIGEIWLFENETTNNPFEDDYLGPVLVMDYENIIKDHVGGYAGRNYRVLELLTGDYTGVRVDRGNAIYWRQLA